MRSAYHKMAGALIGVGLILVVLWLYVTIFPAPTPVFLPVKIDPQENTENEKLKPEDDKVIEVTVALDEVVLPTHGSSVMPKMKQTSSVKPTASPVMTAPPTNTVLMKGKRLLAMSDSKGGIPEIYGDFSQLHMDRYIDGVFKCKGKLVLYDVSGVFGFEPLVELNKKFEPVSTSLSMYYKERPRLLKKPYPVTLMKVIKDIKARDYPRADLQPAIILPRNTEYYILGVLESVLAQSLYEYEYLQGKYFLKSGNLVFKVTSGKKRDGKHQPLSQQILIDFSKTG